MASRSAAITCPACKQSAPIPCAPVIAAYPWRLPNKASVIAYIASLAEETREWLIALYVDAHFNLLAVDTIACGGTSDCPVDAGKIICHGKRIGASGFFLVHNHPSGDSRPSRSDKLATVRLARLAGEFDLHLIEHFVVGRDWMETVVWE